MKNRYAFAAVAATALVVFVPACAMEAPPPLDTIECPADIVWPCPAGAAWAVCTVGNIDIPACAVSAGILVTTCPLTCDALCAVAPEGATCCDADGVCQ